MLPRIYVSALSAAVAVSAFVARDVCNADNCLRALRASSPESRLVQAQQDCSAFLVATVTPLAETTTAYSSVSSTQTIVEGVTTTISVHDTFTSTVHETPTSTVYTSTTTITIGNTIIADKRAVAPTIPVYASACSVASRFSSACSCIGVSIAPSTITLSASTVTVTEPTATWTTIHETFVIATSSTIMFDETVTETVTEPAVTVSTVATTTTTTTKVASPTSTFTISIETANGGFGYFGKFESGPLFNAIYTTDASQAITLILRPDGSLWHGSKVAMGDVKGGALQLFFADSPSVVAARGPLACVINADKILTCQSGNFGNTKTVIRSGIPNPVIFIGKPDTMTAPMYIPLTFRVNYI